MAKFGIYEGIKINRNLVWIGLVVFLISIYFKYKYFGLLLLFLSIVKYFWNLSNWINLICEDLYSLK